MDFFAMKRKKLQSLCKKHGIPANLKNKDMAEKLSLIYKEEKNENPGSHLLRSDADKSNVEIIILDSDSDSDVQMEALDTVAERDFNEKTNVSTEHLIDEEPNQILTTSPRSEVKSDLKIIPHTDDSGTASGSDDASTAVKHTDEVKSSDLNNLMSHSLRSDQDKSKLEITELGSDNDIDVQMEASDTVAEKYSNERTNVSAEYLLDEEPDQFITTSPLSEVKSGDLNNLVSHPLRSNEDKLNLDIKELDSDSDTDVQMEALDTFAEKDSNERTNVSAEHLLDEEPIQSTTSPLSEVKSSDFNNIVFCPLQTDEDKSNLEFKELNSDNDTVVQMEGSDIVAEKDSDEKTNMRAGNLLDKEPNQFLTTSPLSDVKSADLNVQHTVDSDAGEVKSASMQKTNQGREESSMKLTPARSGNVGSFYVEEDMPMSANILEGFGNNMMLGDQTLSESTDVHEDTDLYEGSVEQFNKFDDYHYVKSHSATTCLDASPGVKNTDDNTNVNVENILDEVHSSSFEDSDETPVQFLKTNPLNEVETSDLDAEKMVVTGTATKKRKYTSGAKFGLSQKMNMSPASKEIVGSSAKLLNNSVSPRDIVFCNVEESMEVGANKEQVDPRQEKTLEFSPKLFNNPGSPTNGDVGLCGLEENLEVGVNKENIDPSEDVMLAEPTSTVMGDNEDFIHAVSEELGNNLMEENLDIGVNKENIDPSEDVMHAEPSALVMGDNEDLIQAVSEELGNDLTVDEVASVDDKYDLLEDVPGSVNPGSKKNADSNTYVTGGDILDEVHSSSFEDSDVTPVQFLTTDPLSEAETSDLDVNKMFETATTTRNADISGVKIESSPNTHFGANKEQVDPRQEKTLEFSPKLFNNPGSPTNGDVGLCGLEENLEVGVNKENIDPSEDVMLAEPTSMVMGDNEDFIHAVSEELGNNLMEENLDIGVNKKNIDPSEDVMHAEPSALVMGDNEDLIQAVSEELGNDLTVDEVASVDDKYDLLEDVPGSVNPGSKENADSNTYVTSGDILDEVHSSSFEDSDVTPVQFLTTDPLSEAETSDLDVNKMFETATTTRNADISGVKIESSPNTHFGANKEQVDPRQEKTLEFSPKLFNNPGSPTNGDVGLCGLEENLEVGGNKENIDPSEDVMLAEPTSMVMGDNEDFIHAVSEELGNNLMEENLDIGVNKENIDPSEDFMHAEPSALVMGDNEDLIQAVSEELGNDLTVDEVASVDDKYDLLEDVPGSANPGSKKNADSNTYVTGGDILDEVHSSSFEDSDVTPVQFLPTDPLREAETSDLDVNKMFETAKATKDADTRGAKFESSPKTSLYPTPKKMIGSSTKLLNNSGAPTNFGFCDMEENLQIGVNKENIDPNDEDLHAEPSLVVMRDNEEVDLSNYQMAALEACEEEMRKSSEKTSLVADPEECIGFSLNDLRASTTKGSEAETYFESTALGDVEETCNMEEIMQTNMMEEENNQENYIPAQQEVNKCFDDSGVHDDSGRVGVQDENQAYSASRKRKGSVVNDNSGANSDEEVKADELVPDVLQSSEMESCDFGLQLLFAQDTASGVEDANRKKSDSPSKATPIASGEKNITFTPKFNESSMSHKKMKIDIIEEEDNQEDDISVQRVVSKFFDNSDVHDDIGHVGAEDENQAYSTSLKRKRSDVDEISGANSDSEMESSDFGLQQLFAQDTASGDEGAIQKDSQSKATPVARGEKCIIFTPKFNESSMVHKEMEIAMFEEENNQEGCISAQQEVSKFFDTSDVHDDIGRDGAKDEDLAYSASRKRKMSDVNDTSGANSNEEVKVDELVPVVPQSSEMESCGLGLQQLFAQDNASEDGDAFQKKFDSSSKGTPIANVEKSIIFTPKLHESSMMHKKMRIEMNLSHKPAARDSLGTMKENIKTDKEEVSSTVSRNKFAKRLPLQDLHQN